jgi:hypothetical protein
MAGIRLGRWESARAFKGIICDDVSEFESDMASHAVRSLWRFAEALLRGRADRSPKVEDRADALRAIRSAHRRGLIAKWPAASGCPKNDGVLEA